MSHHEYAAIFEQAEDGTWAGYVPDLPVVLAMGDTLEAAQENMREGIKLWLEEAKKDGLPIPSPSTRAFNIDVAA